MTSSARPFLGGLEHMVLLAVARLDQGAYGLAIREALQATTGRVVSRGALYVTLDRLVRKGYLRSRVADPSPERAGRPRRYFKVTPAGQTALRTTRKALVDLWAEGPLGKVSR